MYKNVGKDCSYITDETNSCCRRPVCPLTVPSTEMPPTRPNGLTYPPPTGPNGQTLPPTVAVPIPTAEPHVVIGYRVDPPGTDPNAPSKTILSIVFHYWADP